MDRVWQGAALRQLRMLAGKSIADAAATCEIGQSAVSQWELGISNPKREHLEHLAQRDQGYRSALDAAEELSPRLFRERGA